MKKNPVRFAFYASLFVLIGAFLFFLFFDDHSRERSLYEQFCPVNCPDTLWTCTVGDIYFASDENGDTMGAAMAGGEINCFSVQFYSRSPAFRLLTLDSVSNPYREGCNHYLYGDAEYSESGCTLTFDADDDTAHYFGEREGEVTLTFVRSDLTAPFSFDREESLEELPFK